MPQSLRVVFLGTPEFAIPSLEGIVRSGAQLCAVVCQPDRRRGRGQQLLPPPVKVWAEAKGIPVHQPEKVRNGRLASLLEPYKADVLVVTAYGRILPKEVLELAPYGAINAHASLLPKYRGAAPIQWAVASGETETGITAMQMDEGLDTGDILMSRSTPIEAEETAVELSQRLSVLAGELLEEVLRKLPAGELKAIPQKHSESSLAPLLKREDGWLDFRRPAKELVNRIRGFQPWPGALIFHVGRQLKVFRATASEDASSDSEERAAEPGTILAASDVLRVATGQGILNIHELQPEGRRRMTAKELLSGHSLKVGDKFELRSPE